MSRATRTGASVLARSAAQRRTSGTRVPKCTAFGSLPGAASSSQSVPSAASRTATWPCSTPLFSARRTGRDCSGGSGTGSGLSGFWSAARAFCAFSASSRHAAAPSAPGGRRPASVHASGGATARWFCPASSASTSSRFAQASRGSLRGNSGSLSSRRSSSSASRRTPCAWRSTCCAGCAKKRHSASRSSGPVVRVAGASNDAAEPVIGAAGSNAGRAPAAPRAATSAVGCSGARCCQGHPPSLASNSLPSPPGASAKRASVSSSSASGAAGLRGRPSFAPTPTWLRCRRSRAAITVSRNR